MIRLTVKNDTLIGTMGDWVHKQRTKYTKKDPIFMKTKAAKVSERRKSECILYRVFGETHSLIFTFHTKMDEIGFEWTPRGYTRMNWEEGFEMLVSVRGMEIFIASCDDPFSLQTISHSIILWMKYQFISP